MRIVIDTNILVSAVLCGRTPEWAIQYVVDRPKSFKWVVSTEILMEYKQVLSRPKLKIIESVREYWLNLIDEATTIVDVNVSVDFPRDPKDAKFLECAIASEADYFITGDRDFVSALPFNTKIISVSEFRNAIGKIGKNEL
jgi:uncharacterized protein